jgi:hypothetical protein
MKALASVQLLALVDELVIEHKQAHARAHMQPQCILCTFSPRSCQCRCTGQRSSVAALACVQMCRNAAVVYHCMRLVGTQRKIVCFSRVARVGVARRPSTSDASRRVASSSVCVPLLADHARSWQQTRIRHRKELSKSDAMQSKPMMLPERYYRGCSPYRRLTAGIS